jgi:enoyl-CoA hydratase
MPDEVTYETDGRVGVITLNRPDVHNALNRAAYDALERFVRDSADRVLIVTGAGRSFCSGDDVREIMGGGAATEDKVVPPRLTPAADALLHTDIPVIAAVNGAAVGWGMELALLADIRVASRKARFGELFVKRGLCSDVAGIGRLAQLVGRETAAELLFSGEVIDAEEAYRIRLVRHLADHDDLMATARRVAEKIAENPPLAVRKLKAGLRTALDPDWNDLGVWVSRSLTELFATEDHREGVRAFIEKREPTYVGR